MNIESVEFWDTYEMLRANTTCPADVFAGERARNAAAEKGTWLDDRIKMQRGFTWMKNALREGEGVSREQRDLLVREKATELVEDWLKTEKNDAGKKMLLVSRLAKGREDAVETLGKQPLEVLKKQMVDEIVDMTNKLAPVMAENVKEAAKNTEKTAKNTEALPQKMNAGALAVAGYLSVPALADDPTVTGAVTGATDYCASLSNEAECFEKVANALVMLALLITATAVLSYAGVAAATVISHVALEKTLMGVTAAIAQEVGLISSFFEFCMRVSMSLTTASMLFGQVAADIRREVEWEEIPFVRENSAQNWVNA